MESVPIDSGCAEYKVGRGGIELHHILIAALEQVSRGFVAAPFLLSDPSGRLSEKRRRQYGHRRFSKGLAYEVVAVRRNSAGRARRTSSLQVFQGPATLVSKTKSEFRLAQSPVSVSRSIEFPRLSLRSGLSPCLFP